MIWRVVHLDNVPWLLEHGLPAASSNELAPHYVGIGNEGLIERRQEVEVPIAPGGVLADYVPFYFTPFSPMMYNIRTGRDVPHVPNGKLVILLSDLHRIAACGLDWLFTDRHAALRLARCHNDLVSLHRIDWDLLRRRDFKRDVDDPEKMDKYQAEALVHRHLPIAAIRGIFVHDEVAVTFLKGCIDRVGITVPVAIGRNWYFR